jgi:kynurenine formamidase
VLSGQPAWAEGTGTVDKPDWYPSHYGEADRLGAINNINTEKTLQATKLVTTGKVYSLAVVTSANTPTGLDRSYEVDAYQLFETPQGENLLSGMDDRITAHMGIGTQIDGFGHVGIDMKHYNGLPVTEVLDGKSLKVYGIHELPPIVTRGVLLDIAALRGAKRLEAGTPINRAEIDAAMERQGVSIGKGDVVLLHTGWLPLMEEDPAAFMAGEPGLGLEGAEYLAGLGVVAVGADNSALEHIPFANPARPYEVHQALIPKSGVYVLEYVKTDELAADKAYEFLFVLGAPRFYGTVQGVVHPVAIR